jgi:mono/diheme cytochrome c family protein
MKNGERQAATSNREPNGRPKMMLSVKRKTGLPSGRVGSKAGAMFSTIAAIALGWCCLASAQSDDKVKAGMELWKGSGCSDCHGAFANGEKDRDEAPTGADLRTSRLNAAALKQVISCGRAGAEMPAFIEGAASAPACSGGAGEYPAPRTLTSDQIDAVIAYLQARIVGRGRITKAECLAYYDDRPDSCEEFK